MITITLNQIKACSPPEGLLENLVKDGTDFDKPFPVSPILESNGLDDTLWVLRCLPEHNNLWCKFACWCALQNIELIKPYCSESDYDLIVNYLKTQDEELRIKAVCVMTDLISHKEITLWSVQAAVNSAYGATCMTDLAGCALWVTTFASYGSGSIDDRKEVQSGKLKQILDAGEWV